MGEIRKFVESIDPSLKDFNPTTKKLELKEVPDINFAELYRYCPEECSKEPDFDGDVYNVFTPLMDQLHQEVLNTFSDILNEDTLILVYGPPKDINEFYRGKFTKKVGPVVLDFACTEEIDFKDIKYQFVASKKFNKICIYPYNKKGPFIGYKYYRYTDAMPTVTNEKVKFPAIISDERYHPPEDYEVIRDE